MADVEITVSDNISTSIETKFKALSNAALDASSSVSKLKAAMSGIGSATQLQAASVSAKDFASALAAVGGDVSRLTPELLGMGAAATTTSADLRGLTVAQVALFRAQQEGANFTADLNARLIAQSTSAKESAAAFQSLGLTTLEATTGLRGYTVAQVEAMKAAQEAATFTSELNARLIENSLSYKSASESAQVFVAASKEVDVANAATSASFLSLVKAIAGLVAIQEVIKGTDAYIKLQNALQLAGLRGDEMAQTQQKLFETADKNGVAIETLAQLYQKLAVSQTILGSSSAQTTQLVQGVAAALREQGASTATAQRATTDLAEIFDLNTVSMRQWRGVLIQVPSIAIAAATGIKRFHGSVSELTKAILAGGVSSKELFQGLLIGFKDTEATASGMALTISASFTVLHNKIAEFISDVNQNTGLVRILSGAILLLADNLNIIIPLIIGFGLAWAAVKIVALVSAFKNLVVAFIEFLPALAAGVIATAEFAIGFIAAAAACLGLAEVLAFITGQSNQFNAWLQGASDQIVNFAAGLIGVGVKANDSFANLVGGANTSSDAIEGTKKKADDLSKSLTGAGTAATTATDQINAGFQRVGNTMDTLIFKMNGGIQKATELYNALQAVGGSERSFQTAGITNTGSNSSIQTLGRPGTPTGGTSAYATGGSFMVGGKPGVDQNMVSFRASKGERVDVTTPAQQRRQASMWEGQGARNTYITVYATDADSFARSRKQMASDLGSMVGA